MYGISENVREMLLHVMNHTSSMYAKSSEKRTFLTFRHSCAYQGGGKGGGGGGGGGGRGGRGGRAVGNVRYFHSCDIMSNYKSSTNFLEFKIDIISNRLPSRSL